MFAIASTLLQAIYYMEKLWLLDAKMHAHQSLRLFSKISLHDNTFLKYTPLYQHCLLEEMRQQR